MDSWTLELRLKQGYAKLKTEELATQCETMVKETIGGIAPVFRGTDGGIFRLLFTGESGTCILVQVKADCLFTVDIHWPKADDYEFRKKVKQFAIALQKSDFYQPPKTREYPYVTPVKRGRPISPYTGCIERLFEYKFDRVVYDEMSKYQHILILHSPQFGNCLFLDNLVNISDSDIEYTRAITGFDQEDYSGKTVLVLGAGDGGILHYLRDRGPAMITVIDIDQMVIEASRVHLRGVCHDALDSLSGNNYEVIVGDCFDYLNKYVEENRQFDYVISDLTDVPVSQDPGAAEWQLLRKVLHLSLKVLKHNGKLFTHGAAYLSSMKMFEEQVKTLGFPLKIEKRIGHVPSFFEEWYFYTLSKDT